MSVTAPRTPQTRAASARASFRALSVQRRALVLLMQRLRFGRLEHLVLRAGEPFLDDPSTRVFHEYKLGNDDGQSRWSDQDEFLLKEQVVDLFAKFDRLGDATIEVLSVKHGLPFRCSVEAQSSSCDTTR